MDNRFAVRVDGFTSNVSLADLEDFFFANYDADDVKLILDTVKRENRGLAFVYFNTEDKQVKALEADGIVLKGESISVTKENEQKDGSGGGYGYGGGFFYFLIYRINDLQASDKKDIIQ